MFEYCFRSFRVYSLISLFFLLIFAPSSYCKEVEDHSECAKPFNCGNLTDLFYPFWGEGRPEICGFKGFKLQCRDRDFPLITIENHEFVVKSINRFQKGMVIVPRILWDGTCPSNSTFNSIILNTNLFSYTPNFDMMISNISLFYNCSNLQSSVHKFSCLVNGEKSDALYGYDRLGGEWWQETSKCKITVKVPVPNSALGENGLNDLWVVLKEGYSIRYKYNETCDRCRESRGICVTDITDPGFICPCPDYSLPDSCPAGRKKTVKVIIGVSTCVGTVAIMAALFFIYQRRKNNPFAPSSLDSQTNTSEFSSDYDMEGGGSTYGGIKLFTYQQLEQATNNFDPSKELGEGGFGTVYYGKLQDGRSVAIKRLYENNYKRAEQFMNEVDLLTHLRHPNLVSLYGCTSRHSRVLLLVYEYIPNGTVADHLHGEKSNPGALPWPTRINIALETASALSYLHASEIIHRDVKTNNILLDNNFRVKVADFGLSRIFPQNLTHVSTVPQGTPGYVDPEYHECYRLTVKSDVYSFGVVLVELISSLPAVDITRHRDEINLSNMAINKIRSNALDELVDKNLGFDSDYDVRKMITAVAELAFRCLKSVKEDRPTMDEVLERLKLIKDKDYGLPKKQESVIISDDSGLLKSGLPPDSPDTVMIRWSSTATTPNISG